MKSSHLSAPLALLAALMVQPGPATPEGEGRAGADPVWAAFELADLAAERKRSGRAYLPFLRVPSLHTGLYELTAGSTDRQSPHDEDEVYYVIKGRGRFTVEEHDQAVGAGTVLYVKAGAEHRFHSIEEDLSVLVVFTSGD